MKQINKINTSSDETFDAEKVKKQNMIMEGAISDRLAGESLSDRVTEISW